MFSDDVAAILTEVGFVATGPESARTIFVGSKASLPSGETAFLTINVGGGQNPEGTHNLIDVPAYVRPSAQIVARAIKYSDAEAAAWVAFNAIFKVRNRFVNGTWWRSVTMKQSEPFDLGEDDQTRPRLAFNFDCVKRLSPATSL